MQVFNGGNVEGFQLLHVDNDTGDVGFVGLVVLLDDLGVKLDQVLLSRSAAKRKACEGGSRVVPIVISST